MVTEEEIKEALPANLRGSVNQTTLNSINIAINDPEIAEVYRDNVLGLTSVLSEGKFKVQDYLNAVRFNTFKLCNNTNQQAWRLTFPERYKRLVANGADGKKISSYVAMYSKNALVVKVATQAAIPFHLVNADSRQAALDELMEVMTDDATSAKVKVEAANAVLTHTKPPEASKIELDISSKAISGIEELRALTDTFAKQQQEKIISGDFTVKEVAESDFIKRLD